MPTLHFILCTAALGCLLAAPAARAEDGGTASAADSEQLFSQVDHNADGQIADDEVDDQHKRLFKRLVRLADKDGDGKLVKDEDEIATAAESLKKLDKDGNGSLTREEVMPGGGPGGPNPEQRLAQLLRRDANGDGIFRP